LSRKQSRHGRNSTRRTIKSAEAASPEEALAVVAAELGLALTFQEQEDGSPGDDWFVRQIPDALPSTRGMVTDHFAFSFWRVKE
jgi:hypothetical protein